MSTLVGVLREMEGQGIRDGMASAASIWGSSNTSNDRTGNNGKGNSSAAFSSSTTSYGQGSFSFSSFSATAGDSSNSNQSDNNFNSINSNIPVCPNPGFPGLDKTRVNFSSTPLNAPAMRNGINAIGNLNINPFHSSSSSGFWSSPNNVFHTPRKSTPLCETSVSRAPFTYAEASTSSQKNTQKSNHVFLSRPRLVKISRRGSNPSKGKFAASTGDLFCTGDGKYSSNVDNSGYNPFRTNSAASLAEQPCNCFVQDLNRGSAPGSFLSGQNVSRTEFKEVPNRRPKLSVVKDFANQREDLHNRFNSWNPFAGASDALKHNGGNTQTADESESGGINMYLKTPEMGGFTFRTNIEEKLAARDIACNVTSGFTFRANSQEKLAAKENVVSVATGSNFTANPEEKLAAKKYVSNATSGFTFKPNADEKIAATENVSNVASSFTFRAKPEEKLDVATSYILRAKPEENLAAKENISNVTSGLTSKPNVDEKLAAQENVSNVARAFTFRANPQEKQMSNKDEDHVASSFTFKANTGEKLVAKESEGNVASGFTFRANTEAKENVGNVSGGFAFRANREAKENVGNVPGGFAFRATTEAKENVGNVSGGFAFRANREVKENVGNVPGGFAFRANREVKENAGNVPGGFAFRANREAKENVGNVPGGFAFRANTEAKENVGNVSGGFAFGANTESKENVGNVPGGFAFRANTKEKPGVKKNAGHVTRGGFSVSRRAGRGSKSTIGIVGNEVNLSGSLAADNSQQATEVTKMDSVAGDACSCPTKSTGQEGFNFCASKPRADVDSRHLQDLHSSNSLHSPKNGGGFPFNDSFAAQSSISSSNSLKNSGGCTYDNPFESQDPISSSKSESSKAKSKFGLAEGSPIPSTFTFNMVERVESQRKEDAKPCPPVEPFAFSAGSVSFSPVSSFFGGSVKEAINKAPPDALSSVREVGAIPSPVEVPRSEDYLSERNSSWPSMESLSSSLNEMFEFSANKGAGKRYGTGKRREKSQLPASMQRRPGRRHVTKSKRYMPSSTVDSMGHPPNHDEGGSPMDFSPCNEIPSQGAFQFGSHNVPDLGQSSVAYGCPVQSVPFGCHNMSDLGQSSVACDSSLQSSGDQIQQNLHESFVMEAKVEELRVAAANLHIGADQEINDVNICQEESSNGGEIWQRAGANQGNSFVFNVCNQWERPHCEEEASAPSSENEWLNSRMEKVRIDDGENTTSAAKPEGSDQSRQFTFVASPSSSILASTIRQHSRRSHQLRGAENIRGSSSNVKIELPPFSSQPFVQRRVPGPKGDLSQDKATAEISERTSDLPSATGSLSSLPKQKEEIGTAVSPRAVKSAAAEQACERWRLRGNQAYASGDFPKAEDYYSRGASSVSPNETSQSCVRASMLCYSNRAATRMAVGRMREALADCMRAMAIDPSFLRVQIRAASCHLALGESEAAVRLFKECLRSAKELETQDSKIVTEASEGLRKAQHGWEYTDRAAELLNMTSSADATNALRIVNEALSISPHSERLLELKALALFFLRKYEEVVQVCEQSLDSAERNYCFVNNDSQWGSEDAPGSPDRFSVKLWRWRMIAKSHFHLGRLELALSLLLKYEELNSAAEKSGRQCMESLASLVATIRDLLRHKAAGNEAFQAAKHAEAVEHYTAALACNGESWPFTAVCFCNRAAASQALGNIADAIADCSRAIALDANYPKAISRRATLHEMVRNYGQACNDLRRLIILLERQQQQNKGNQSEKLGSLSTNTHDLRQARERLIKAEEEMKRGNPLDHYLILGVEASCTAAEIKKAYRKAALRHHPDKAGQFLVRSDSGDDGVWKEVGEEVRRDAERLFKMIGEAYAILSDPSKRIRYDTEEEMRKLRTRGNNSGSQTVSDAYCHQYEKGGRRQRDRWDSWNGYANLYQRWQSGPDAAQPDTYARRGSNNSKSNEGSRWNEWDDF